MENQLDNFDMKAFHTTLDAERQARRLSWVELTAAVNEPFRGTSSIPISVTTIRDIPKKRTVASAVVLQLLRWLGRTPESFLSRRTSAPTADEALPEPGPSRILRFDTGAMHTALNVERGRRGMTWKQLADELPGFTPSMLTNLETKPLIGFPHVMTITQWLGRSAASFVRDYGR